MLLVEMMACALVRNFLAIQRFGSWHCERTNSLAMVDMNRISLNSNLSDESIQLVPIAIGDENGEFKFAINCRHWSCDHQHAVHLNSESLLLSTTRLQVLVDEIKRWLDSDDARRTAFAGDFQLADDNAKAEFALKFADRPDIISSDDKPFITANFRIGRLIGEFSFVTDQSCLASFARDIARAVAGTGR